MRLKAVKDTNMPVATALGASMTAKNISALIGGGLCTPLTIRDSKQLV